MGISIYNNQRRHVLPIVHHHHHLSLLSISKIDRRTFHVTTNNKRVKCRCKQVSFKKFLEMFSVWLGLNTVWQTVPGRAGMTEGSLIELGFERWLPLQEVTGRQEARTRRRCCSEFNHFSHVGRSLVGMNEVYQEAQFVENSRFIGS